MTSVNPGANGMNWNEYLSGQIITMASMKEGGSLQQAIIGIIFLKIMESITKVIPILWESILAFVKYYMNKKKDQLYNKLKDNINILPDKSIKGSITFQKQEDEENDNKDIVMLSLIQYISSLKTSEELLYNNRYFVINTKEFLLKPDIYCKIVQFNKDSNGKITEYEFKIYSYEYDIEYLKAFVETIKEEYIVEQTNKLGKQQYYFDEKILSIPKDNKGNIRYDIAMKNLVFDMTMFNTNKSLNNVFGSHLNIVKRRVDIFLNNPKWYEKKGIPYTLGILLSGPPGTGKTSLIKAIANDCKRHIFNISLRDSTTQSQLKHLFFNNNIHILENGVTKILNIPLEKRLYVIEDIDCLTDVVLDRKLKQNNNNKMDKENNKNKTDKENNTNETNEETNDNNPKSVENNNVLGGLLCANDINSGFSQIDFETTNNNNNNNLDFAAQMRMMMEDRKTIPSSNSSNNSNSSSNSNNEENSEKLTLSFLLNLLDGVLETPGRILIMTSNYPEKLDKALIRPGRIDVNIRVGYCQESMIEEMFRFFYENDNFSLPDTFEYHNKITPAELNKILLNNFDCMDDAYQQLIEECQKKISINENE